MKTLKKILLVVVLGCIGYAAAWFLRRDETQEKLFSILGEDTYLAILDKVRLAGDLLMWPIEYIRALLP